MIDLLDKGIVVYGQPLKKYKIVVPLSGGKDSQVCMELAVKEVGAENVLGLFCDTQYEHPITYEHICKVAIDNNIDLVMLCAGSVLEVCSKYKRFPGGGARHCTDELKIRPSKMFYEALAKKQGGFEVWYGMRSDESKEREARYEDKITNDLYPPHEIMSKYPKKLEKLGVMFKLPILNWATSEVFKFLNGRGNPLYSMGFVRVGCFPCLAGGEAHQMRAFYFDCIGLAHFGIAKQISIIAERPVLVTKKYYDQGPGCAICEI